MSVFRAAVVQFLQTAPDVKDLAPGGIWSKAAPEEAASYPLVVVSFQQPPAGERCFQAVAYEESVLIVKAIDFSTSSAKAGQLAAAIRAALDGAEIPITGYTLINATWLSDLDYIEDAEEGLYQHEGGLYQVTARQ